MDFLLAKIKKNDEILMLTSRYRNLIKLPEILHENCKEYDPRYKLEDEEWYKIENFSKTDFFNPLTHQDFFSTSYNQIKTEQYTQIEYLCFKQEDMFLFQKISPSQFLRRTYIDILQSFSSEPMIVENSKIIVLREGADAIYDKKNDTLYFRNFSKLKTFFKDIDMLYREATDEEIKEFLGFDFIQITPDFTYQHIGLANRKRIALILDKVKTLQEEEKSLLFDYIHEYCSDIIYQDKTFQISTEKQLKELIFGLEQRYYTTLLDNEKRLANSISILKENL